MLCSSGERSLPLTITTSFTDQTFHPFFNHLFSVFCFFLVLLILISILIFFGGEFFFNAMWGMCDG